MNKNILKIYRNRKSFTLLEVVFATTIIILFLGALIEIFNVSSKNIVVSKHQLVATNLAREASDKVRQTRDNYWLGGGTAWPVTLPATFPDQTFEGVKYTTTVTYTQSTNITKVKFEVKWADFSVTPNHTITMTTYLTNWKK